MAGKSSSGSSRTRSPAKSAGGRGLVGIKAGRLRSVCGTLLKQKTVALFRHYPDALAGEEEALHQVRVCSRRLRAAIGLLVEKSEGRRALRAQRLLAQLTRSAGTARDLDVVLAAFDERLAGVAKRTREQIRLRQRLAACRRRVRERVIRSLLDLPIARLREDLAEISSRACPDPTTAEQRFRVLCGRESRKLTEGFTDLGALLDVATLHRLRRRTRRLRYAVEVHQEIWGDSLSATKPWKELQDRIGIIHDQHVLAEWLDRQAKADARRGQPAFAAAAEAESSSARRTMQRLHDELLAVGPTELVRQGLAAVGAQPPAPTE